MTRSGMLTVPRLGKYRNRDGRQEDRPDVPMIEMYYKIEHKEWQRAWRHIYP